MMDESKYNEVLASWTPETVENYLAACELTGADPRSALTSEGPDDTALCHAFIANRIPPRFRKICEKYVIYKVTRREIGAARLVGIFERADAKIAHVPDDMFTRVLSTFEDASPVTVVHAALLEEAGLPALMAHEVREYECNVEVNTLPDFDYVRNYMAVHALLGVQLRKGYYTHRWEYLRGALNEKYCTGPLLDAKYFGDSLHPMELEEALETIERTKVDIAYLDSLDLDSIPDGIKNGCLAKNARGYLELKATLPGIDDCLAVKVVNTRTLDIAPLALKAADHGVDPVKLIRACVPGPPRTRRARRMWKFDVKPFAVARDRVAALLELLEHPSPLDALGSCPSKHAVDGLREFYRLKGYSLSASTHTTADGRYVDADFWITPISRTP
jgi:hypothetical protein